MKGLVLKRVAIAIGSNLGNREAAVAFAATRLSSLFSNFILSDVVETWPVGEGTEDRNLYLNAAAIGGHRSLPQQILDFCSRSSATSGASGRSRTPHARSISI